MLEAVRLVIWDLDETFWRGTLTEGGITEYVQAHHDIVIELARRGIISSVCSKNDEDQVLSILRERGILDYIVFPSISWEPKGGRLAALIETIQLRPASVMFIDDNHGNRAEAASVVAGLQVEDETFIARMLDDPRFKGKDDRALSRLAQYKLLETRKKDELKAAGDNAGFLRGCDVRVHVEYDVLGNLDRAIELINRTNQLNFTKRRLPEDMAAAREKLTSDVTTRGRQSGLIRVMDRYGDYGFVGFFMTENGAIDIKSGAMAQTLLHYCFSCRVLGMLVEQWFYERLQRPKLKVVGDVLTDLSVCRDIDWIRMVLSADAGALAEGRMLPEIRIHGGCEAQSIAHYLGAHADKVACSANFFAGAYFVRMNGAALLMSACDRRNPAFQLEAKALQIPYEMLVSSYFDAAAPNTLFVFGGQWDCPGGVRYRHKEHGWEIRIEQLDLGGGLDVVAVSDDDLAARLAALEVRAEKRDLISAVSWQLHRNYESVRHPDPDTLAAQMRALFDRVPSGCRMLLILDHEVIRYGDGSLRNSRAVATYNEQICSIVESYPFVGVVPFGKFIENEDEILKGGNHYERAVYHRMAEGIVNAVTTLRLKGEADAAASLPVCSGAAHVSVAAPLRGYDMQLQAPLDEKSACSEIMLSYKAKRFDEADDLARRALKRFPDSLAVWLEYGHVALSRNDAVGAVERFAAALEKFGPKVELYRWNCVALRKCKRFADAATLIETGLQHFPESQWLHCEEAWLLSQTKPVADVLGKWAQIRTKFPANEESYWAAAHEALRSGQLDLAEEISVAGYARFPKDRYVLWQWARAATRRGDWNEAARRWAVAGSLYPNMPEIRDDIGQFNLSRQLAEAESTPAPPAVALPASDSRSDLAALMLRFESLGDNCEFGMVQRLAGVEPLSLLRWANISPDRLIAMLDTKFHDVGAPGSAVLSLSASGEYYLDDAYIGMHTFIHAGQVSESAAMQKCLLRLRFLSRKLASDLAESDKIFVYKSHTGALPESSIDSIFLALRKYGPVRLLCVHRAEPERGGRRVRKLRDGLYVAAMPELTADPLAARHRASLWHDICRDVIELVEG